MMSFQIKTLLRAAAPFMILLAALAAVSGCRKAESPEKAAARASKTEAVDIEKLAIPDDVMNGFQKQNELEAASEVETAAPMGKSGANLFDKSTFPGTEHLRLNPAIPAAGQPLHIAAQVLERVACYDTEKAQMHISGQIVRLIIPKSDDQEFCKNRDSLAQSDFTIDDPKAGPLLLALFLDGKYHLARRIVVRTPEEAAEENSYEALRDRYVAGDPQDQAEAAQALFDLKSRRAFIFLFTQLDSAPATIQAAFNHRFFQVMQPIPDPKALKLMIDLLQYPRLRTYVSRKLNQIGQKDRVVPELIFYLEKAEDPIERGDLAELLESITKQSFGEDRDAWKEWWRQGRKE